MFDAIITGIIATLIFEIVKYIIFKLIDLSQKRRIPFSITGIWVTYHESVHPDTNEKHTAYELLILKIKKGNILTQIYQYTSDERKHRYKGCGYVRGPKLSIAYEEFNNQNSDLTGVYLLKNSKKTEHNTYLKGTYLEFQGKNDEAKVHEYCLFPYSPSFFNKICLKYLGQQYIFYHMKKERFKEYVENQMQ